MHLKNTLIKNIRNISRIYENQLNTVYITESGLYKLLIKSCMKKAEKFQAWLIEIALPKLIQYSKQETK
jgi:prophage antirepressor-like protein